MKTWQGSLGVSEFEGIVSPAYIVCALREDMNPRFIHYVLRSDPYVFEYNRISYGVRVGQWDMRYDEFKRIPLYLPPAPEQEEIAAFLDVRLNELSQLISRYRQLVGVAAKSLAEKEKSLLHGYRRSLIAEAVTGKLNVRHSELPSFDRAEISEGIDNYPACSEEEETNDTEGTSDDDE
jgi:type I restriction enzyme S subunit